jgi:hypothetical protein
MVNRRGRKIYQTPDFAVLLLTTTQGHSEGRNIMTDRNRTFEKPKQPGWFFATPEAVVL